MFIQNFGELEIKPSTKEAVEIVQETFDEIDPNLVYTNFDSRYSYVGFDGIEHSELEVPLKEAVKRLKKKGISLHGVLTYDGDASGEIHVKDGKVTVT